MFPRKNRKSKKIVCWKSFRVIAETLGCKNSSVSVAIKDVPEEKWKEEVWDKSIIEEKEFLYKNPGYTCTWESYKIKVLRYNMRFVADSGSGPLRYNPLLGGHATGVLKLKRGIKNDNYRIVTIN